MASFITLPEVANITGLSEEAVLDLGLRHLMPRPAWRGPSDFQRLLWDETAIRQWWKGR